MYTHTVQYYETDKMGITHHSNYIRWMEEARVDFLANAGWSYEKLEAEGIISPVVAVNCSYKKNTTFADKVDIEVKIKEFNGVKLKLGYTMFHGSALVCEAESVHCFVNSDGHLIRLKREYPDFCGMLEKNVSD
ncbi:acyl-CoA thioesterase [bacterium]|nr:acyl-CoA thioesterase [bacterium]